MAMAVEQAIKELNEQKAALDKHIAKGGEYCEDYAEALGMGIKALKKQAPRALHNFGNGIGDCPFCGKGLDDNMKRCDDCGQLISPFLSYCVSKCCTECKHNNSGKVCDLYPDKVDEIRRIHEEADNGQ